MVALLLDYGRKKAVRSEGIFRIIDRGGYELIVMVMFVHSRVGIAVNCMPEKPWKKTNFTRFLVTQLLVDFFNSIIPAEIP